MTAKAPPVDLGTFYNSIFAPRGFGLAAHHIPMVQMLDDTRISQGMVILPPGAGKSSLLNVAYPAYRIGVQPDITILGLSGGEKLIGTFLGALQEIIEHSPIYRRFFPNVRPDKGRGWSSEKGLFVTGRPIGDQDASYYPAGLASKSITGVHAREIIMDDLHDRENSNTKEARDKVKDIFIQNILGRGDPRGCRYIMIGRRWDKDDLYGEQMATGEWVVLHTPAQRPGEVRLWMDVFVPNDMTCVFTETAKYVGRHPNKRGHMYRAYYGADPSKRGFYWPDSKTKWIEYFQALTHKPSTARIVYNGDTEAVEDAVFLPEDFGRYVAPDDLSKALSSPAVTKFVRADNTELIQAWDTAAGKNTSESMSSNLTALLVPCNRWHRGENEELVGKCEHHYDVLLIDSLLKNLDFKQLADAFRTQFRKWFPKKVLVEDKSSGISLIQAFQGSEIPLVALKVHEGKVDRATNGIGGGAASVQGWAKMGRILIPEGAVWAPEFIKNVCAFRGEKDGRSDQFDTLVHAVAYAISRSSKRVVMPSEELIERQQARNDSGLDLDLPFNPFTGMCGAPCKHYGIINGSTWCKQHERKAVALDGCQHWEAG
jgi:predicted phage terminase large subunit-like protein